MSFSTLLAGLAVDLDEYLYLPHEIVLTPDSNVLAGDVLGFHCYALDGTLLWQKRSEHPSYEYGVGYFTWMRMIVVQYI